MMYGCAFLMKCTCVYAVSFDRVGLIDFFKYKCGFTGFMGSRTPPQQ